MPAWPPLLAENISPPMAEEDLPRWWQRLLGKTRGPSASRMADLEQRNKTLLDRLQILETRSRASEQAAHTLWTVNQTWAWDDNATVCLRKPLS